MVFGLFEGKIEISLNKTNFAFGETAEGNLSLKLKKEKQARQLRVSIVAEKQVSQYGTSPRGGMKKSSNKDILFSTDVILDGEKLYSPPGAEYKFKIQVPQKSAIPAMPEGGLGAALKAVQFLRGQTSQLRWFIIGTLDVPGAIDIRKRVQISVQ